MSTNPTLPYASAEPARRWRRRLIWSVVLVSLALPIFALMATAVDRLSPALPQQPIARPVDLGISVTTPARAPATQPAAAAEPLLMPPPPRFDVAKVQTASVRRHLEALKRDNVAARQRAQQIVRGHFAQASAGAPVFAGDIIGPFDGIKTLYLVSKGGVKRWWHEDRSIDPVGAHVRWNYERHVTSGPKIERAIRAALVQFETDLRANRNRAIQAIAQDIDAQDLAVAIVIDEQKLAAGCEAEIRDAVAKLMSQRLAEGAAVETAGIIVASEGMAAATGMVVRLVVIKLATVPVSAAVGSTGAGAAIGSVVPGVGNTVGAVTGLLVGIAVDCALTHRQTKRVTKSVRDVLASTEQAVLDGHDGAGGLNRVFDDALAAQDKAIDRLIADELYAAAAPAPAPAAPTRQRSGL